jgi:hypothetical protein
VDKEEWKEILEKASSELCTALNKFGPNEILDLLVVHSHNDPVVYDLLARFPSVVSLREFLGTLPIVRMEEKT